MRILLVDDHGLMRDGLRAILERERMQVVGEAEDARDAAGLARTLHADVVVMNVSGPQPSGVAATTRLLAEAPGVKVIGLSAHADPKSASATMKAGAVGYLLKSSAFEELIQAVRLVASGGKYVSPAVARVTLEGANGTSEPPGAHSRHTPALLRSAKPLSGREREVLQLLAEGQSSKEIARSLCVAIATVETHRRQIMDKLGLRTIAELTKYAIRAGLTSL
jgi:DNA-binding NarL/FixJ family response regulator